MMHTDYVSQIVHDTVYNISSISRSYKKLSYLRATARRLMSVEISSTAAQLHGLSCVVCFVI